MTNKFKNVKKKSKSGIDFPMLMGDHIISDT